VVSDERDNELVSGNDALKELWKQKFVSNQLSINTVFYDSFELYK